MSACIHREPVADRDPRVAVQLARWMFSWKSTSMNSRRAVILSGTRLHGIAPGCSTHPPDDSARLVDTACAVTGHTLVSVDMRFGFIADDREMYEWETLGWVLMLVGLDMRVGSKSRDTTLYLVSRVPLPIVCICDSPESLGEDHLIEYLCTRLPVEDPPARVINTPVRNATGCIGDPRLVWQLAHWLESWKPTNEKRSVLITGGGCTGKTTSARMVCDVARYDVANILASNVLSLRDLMVRARVRA